MPHPIPIPITLVIALMLSISGCASWFRPQAQKVSDPAHYSQNSLDWQGVYTGRFTGTESPDIMLLLNNDETYRLESLGFSEVKGTFRWLDGGNAIQLALPPDKDWPSLYRVGENRLSPVSPVTGPLASNFLIKESDHLKESVWRLPASLTGNENPPYLIIKALGNQISGFGGCNIFFGNYSQTDDQGISFFNIASTKMACPALVTEEAFIQNLGRAARFEIASEGLKFFSIDGEVLLELTLDTALGFK